MAELANSRLLRAALAGRPDDPASDARERLRSSHLDCKERAVLLAGEISRNFPHLTVHDGTHLDAVWEMVDLAAGDAVELNALEAYILGGAILLHDLGLAIAAYPDPDALHAAPRWSDAVAVVLEKRLSRTPTKGEIAAADNSVERAAEELLLRQLHATHAEELALLHWVDDRGEPQYLIENVELRRATGAVIGLIAHSHWWETDELAHHFDRRLGPPPRCPAEWTADLLKIACLLRVADALHIDARRAPMFLRAVRRPSDRSADHWAFQERLNRPFVRGDRVEFTTGDRFLPSDSRAWWLCYETLRDTDRWLREVDALLSDLGRRRLPVRGVAGVDHPQRLARLVPTANWTPVDTHIQVSNVAALVAKLGGRELYGDEPSAALRELIQNGADAVRARRTLQGRPPDWGVVTVRTGHDDDRDWIEVEDQGVGMSEHVLTMALLDFGTSFWASPELPSEFPGLLAGGFEAVGQYGIGFFSVFMLGHRVRITTRPFRASEADTLVLSFDGLTERPLLQQAADVERLPEGGTCVRVWLDHALTDEEGVLRRGSQTWSLPELCEWLCPALDVTVRVEPSHGEATSISPGWETLSAEDLVSRARVLKPEDRTANALLEPYFANLRALHDTDDEIVARLAIYPHFDLSLDWRHEDPGVVTVGGLRASSLTGIMGLAVGSSANAARNVAIPVVPKTALAAWATEQAMLLDQLDVDSRRKATGAAIVRLCGGDTGPLPIAETTGGWLDRDGVRAWAMGLTEIVVLQDAGLSFERDRYGSFELADNVLAVAMGWPGILQSRHSDVAHFQWPAIDVQEEPRLTPSSLEGWVLGAAAAAWNVSFKEIVAVSDIPSDDHRVVGVIGARDGESVRYDYVRIIRRPGLHR